MRKTQGERLRKGGYWAGQSVHYVCHSLDRGLYKNDQGGRWGQKINFISSFLVRFTEKQKVECFNQNITSWKCLFVCAMDHEAVWGGQQSRLYVRHLFYSLFSKPFLFKVRISANRTLIPNVRFGLRKKILFHSHLTLEIICSIFFLCEGGGSNINNPGEET